MIVVADEKGKNYQDRSILNIRSLFPDQKYGKGQMFPLPYVDRYSHDQVDTRAELHLIRSSDRKLKLTRLGTQCVLVKVTAQQHKYSLDKNKLEKFSMNHL